jgi:hypothetical protein
MPPEETPVRLLQRLGTSSRESEAVIRLIEVSIPDAFRVQPGQRIA